MAVERLCVQSAVECEKNAEVGPTVALKLDLGSPFCLRWRGQAEEFVPFSFTAIF